MTAFVLAVTVLVGLAPAGRAGASLAQAQQVGDYLALQVQGDGSVIEPYSALPSVTMTVNVALGLAVAGNHPVELGLALSHVEANTTAYVTEAGQNLTGRYAWLIMLAVATDGDPTAFGADRIDLVAGLQSYYGSEEPGLYGPTNEYASVMNHSLALLALDAAGIAPPAEAIDWLEAQQCEAGGNEVGAWEAYRGPQGSGLVPCAVSTVTDYESPEVNSTSFAIQALAVLGRTSSFSAARTWLADLQATATGADGGVGQFMGDASDPNSTALLLQAIVALGDDPTAPPWGTVGIGPLGSLATWLLTTGPEAGGLSSPYSAGYADLYATYQGVWGLIPRAFPLIPVEIVDPPSTTATSGSNRLAPTFTG